MKRKKNIISTDKMDKRFLPHTKYNKFRWFAKWLKFEDTLPDIDDRVIFSLSIKEYGLNGVVHPELRGAALEYFNTHVRPELDRQHKRLEKGLEI